MLSNSKWLAALLLLLSLTALTADSTIKPGLNFLKSAAVPGWGQISADRNYGFVFLLSEVSLWSLRFYYDQESDNNDEASFKYAIRHAGVDPYGSYDEDFFAAMREFHCSGFEEGGYNQHVAEDAAELFPDDPQAQQGYISQNAYDESHYWAWSSDDHQSNYSSYRRNIDEYADYMKLVAGVIAVNHIFSAFDALRVSNRMKRLQLGVDFNSDHQTMLTCTYRF